MSTLGRPGAFGLPLNDLRPGPGDDDSRPDRRLRLAVKRPKARRRRRRFPSDASDDAQGGLGCTVGARLTVGRFSAGPCQGRRGAVSVSEQTSACRSSGLLRRVAQSSAITLSRQEFRDEPVRHGTLWLVFPTRGVTRCCWPADFPLSGSTSIDARPHTQHRPQGIRRPAFIN